MKNKFLIAVSGLFVFMTGCSSYDKKLPTVSPDVSAISPRQENRDAWITVGFVDGTLKTTHIPNATDSSTLELFKSFQSTHDLDRATFLFLDRKVKRAVVAVGTSLYYNTVEYAPLDVAFRGLIDNASKASLLVVVPPCSGSNRKKIDIENKRGSLNCWADLAKKNRLNEEMKNFSAYIVDSLGADFSELTNVCYLGTSRFSWFALTQSPALTPKNAAATFIVISPLINLEGVFEFKGVHVPPQLPTEFLKKSIIFAGTHKVDPRVNEKYLFELKKELGDALQINVIDGAGHAYESPEAMIRFAKEHCQ